MQQLFTSETAATAIAFIAFFICATIVALGCTISVQWRKARQAEISGALKKEMIDRGMTADDIVKILGASSKAAEATQAVELAKQGMSADEIEKILKASSTPL